jgi:spore coat polysaccharide biosynthesis protein SpsF
MIIGLIQARMGSSRLPGKVLREINGKPILQLLIERLSPSTLVDEFIIVTTELPEDDAIENWCKKSGVKCFRGSDWDVLDRFYSAVSEMDHLTSIVRICSDNPLHSYKVVDFVVNEYLKSKKTYFSNSNQEPDYLEDGFDVEVFSFSSLEDAWKNAKLLSEREHVCPYIKKHNPCGWKKAHPAYHFKLSVDTQADLNAVEQIYTELKGQPDFSIEEVVALLQAKPEILDINKESEINSGFQKSLKEDRIVK